MLKKRSAREFALEYALPLIFFCVIIIFFSFGLSSINKTTTEETLKMAQQSVTRATIQCYAIEGQYPPDVAYLEENYGLQINRDQYVVHYDSFASNLMPDISVFALEESK